MERLELDEDSVIKRFEYTYFVRCSTVLLGNGIRHKSL